VTGPRTLLGAALLVATMCVAPAVGAHVHVGHAGETIDQLATRYYGKADFSMVIRAANGFVHPDDGRVLEGERIEIPESLLHEVEAKETWDTLAERYLGSPRRGRFLAELNDRTPESAPPAGTLVDVPYQLLYILAPGESLRSVARMFLGKERGTDWLRAYNLSRKKKFGRGDALLVPLSRLAIRPEERQRIEALAPKKGRAAPDLEAQREAAARVASLRGIYDDGRYVEVIAEGQSLLAGGLLTVPQHVGVLKYVAFACVAFGERERAVTAFAKALEIQPAMELSPVTTSPKILEVFRVARERVAASQ
jgi:phage tail protein X